MFTEPETMKWPMKAKGKVGIVFVLEVRMEAGKTLEEKK